MTAFIGRREFITLFGGAAAAWPLRSQGQETKAATIGFLGATTSAVGQPWLDAFIQGLRELNWVSGRNYTMQINWAEGRRERAAELAAEYVQRKVDVIVTWATGPALASKQATSTIPIVFALATDPVGSGLVTSLSRPGGNVTGLSALNIDLIGKRIELFHEIAPTFRRLAILGNVGIPDTAAETRTLAEVARSIGLQVAILEVRRKDDIASAFNDLRDRADALFVVGDPLTFSNRVDIIAAAEAAKLPATYANRDFVIAGGLMSYGPNFPALFRRTAALVDKVLRGTKPAEIPVEQPTKIDLVINLKTANALGLDVPPSLLARADEVIE
jgi:putative ABC transport system substrate-binding protein